MSFSVLTTESSLSPSSRVSVNVTFNETDYTVMEGGEVVVTLLLCGDPVTDVVVTVQTENGSAGV